MNAEDKEILEATNSPLGSKIIDMNVMLFVERPNGSVSELWFLADCKHVTYDENCAECASQEDARNEARNKYWRSK